MKAELCDLVEVSTDDMLGWFGACETPDECRELAGELREAIDSVAGSHAELLSRDGAPRPDPLRASVFDSLCLAGLSAAIFRE